MAMAAQLEFNLTSLGNNLQDLAQAKRWLVAFSGGLDSTVLLHGLAQLRQTETWLPQLLAIHINHGLSEEADNWQRHCQQFCATWDIPFISETISVTASGEGLEAAAREARYRAIEKHLQAEDVLLTAHHRDDQAETLLLRLLRGAGVRGLAAMARERKLGDVPIKRPLLPFSRAQLADYAKLHKLAYCEDESNQQPHFDRNFLRNDVLPLLQQRWPNLSQRWAQTADNLADSDRALAELAGIDLAFCKAETARMGWRLQLNDFFRLSVERRNNLLRYWCEQSGLPPPERLHLMMLASAIENSENDPDYPVAIQWPGVTLRSFRACLYLLPSQKLEATIDISANQELTLNQQTISLPDGGRITVTLGHNGLRTDLGPLSLRWREGGEHCHPEWRRHSQSLKKCLQEYGLEPWLRERLPLIYAGERLVAVADLWVNAGFRAPEIESGLIFRWRYPHSESSQ